MFVLTKFRVDEIFFFFLIEGKRRTIIIGFLDYIPEKSTARQGIKQVLGEEAARHSGRNLIFGLLQRTDTIGNQLL
jgi:hypothetical protein